MSGVLGALRFISLKTAKHHKFLCGLGHGVDSAKYAVSCRVGVSCRVCGCPKSACSCMSKHLGNTCLQAINTCAVAQCVSTWAESMAYMVDLCLRPELLEKMLHSFCHNLCGLGKRYLLSSPSCQCPWQKQGCTYVIFGSRGGVKQISGRKTAHKHKLFGPVGLGTTRVCPRGKPRLSPYFTAKAQFIPGTDPVCPRDKLGSKRGRES